MRTAVGLLLFLLTGASSAAADLAVQREPPAVAKYPPARRVSCSSCDRLPWNSLHKVRKAHVPFGGLRPTYALGLPWGGLADPCPPLRFIRQAVLVRKG